MEEWYKKIHFWNNLCVLNAHSLPVVVIVSGQCAARSVWVWVGRRDVDAIAHVGNIMYCCSEAWLPLIIDLGDIGELQYTVYEYMQMTIKFKYFFRALDMDTKKYCVMFMHFMKNTKPMNKMVGQILMHYQLPHHYMSHPTVMSDTFVCVISDMVFLGLSPQKYIAWLLILCHPWPLI